MQSLPPIENPKIHGGVLPAFLKTWLNVCIHTKTFFESVRNSRVLIPSIIFGMIILWIASTFNLLLHYVITLDAFYLQFFYFLLLVGWLGGLLSIFFWGFLIHSSMLIFLGSQTHKGFSMTLRVIAYAHAPHLFYLFPLVGWLIGIIWSTILEIYGLATTHQIHIWRAIGSVLCPKILIYFFLSLMVFIS